MARACRYRGSPSVIRPETRDRLLAPSGRIGPRMRGGVGVGAPIDGWDHYLDWPKRAEGSGPWAAAWGAPMSEESGHEAPPGEQPVFALERVYVRDISFESPNTPEVFTWQGQPQVNVELGTEGRWITDEGHAESVLTVTVRSTLEDATVFIAEVQQAGLFRLSGFSEEQVEQIIGVNCPTILFPYAREAIANLVGRGGFQQLQLDPVNFQAIFEQSREQAEEGAQH